MTSSVVMGTTLGVTRAATWAVLRSSPPVEVEEARALLICSERSEAWITSLCSLPTMLPT